MSKETKEEDKLMMASGGMDDYVPSEEEDIDTLNEEEVTWVKALRDYKLTPGVNAYELTEFLRTFNEKEKQKHAEKTETKTFSKPNIGITSSTPQINTPIVVPTGNQHYCPKLSIFSGDNNKGEVSWEAYKYEIESLIEEHTVTEEQVLLGIRRSLKGTASDILRRLGTGISVKDVVRKLSSTYGSIESSESVMRKLYSCIQGSDSISTYAVKLEDLYAQAVDLKAVIRSDDLLKQILYQGLNLDLKHIAQYKYDKISDYDKFKIELRKLEADLKLPETKGKTCHSAQKVEDKNSDFYRLENTVKQLQQKIEKLELEKQIPDTNNTTTYRSDNRQWTDNRQWRGAYNRGRGYRGRGARGYEPRRPLASNTFRGACNRCGDRGHFARDCTTISCYRCGEKGHYARNCTVNYADIEKKNTLKE